MRLDRLGWLLIALLAACGGNEDGGGKGGPDDDDDDEEEVPTTALQAYILEPNGNTTAIAGEPLRLRAEFRRSGDRVDPAPVTWTSSLSGAIGTGNPLDDVPLPVGTHTLTVSGSYGGETSSAQVTVEVGTMAVRISSPRHRDRVPAIASIAFNAESEITFGGVTTKLVAGTAGLGERKATFAWSSSTGGAFGGSSDSFGMGASALPAGTQTISVTVSDTLAGGTGEDSTATVTLFVAPANSAPTATITQPLCPRDHFVGQALSFSGVVADPDAADADIVGVWKDGIDGYGSEGATFELPASLVGKHQVSFSVQDSQGASGASICDVYVVEAGQSRASLFPDTAAINDNLVLDDDDVHFLAADAAGLWVGNEQGLAVFTPALAPLGEYDSVDLDVTLVISSMTVEDAVLAATEAVIATNLGLAACDYAAGALSNCVELRDGNFTGAALSGTLAAGLVVGASSAGLHLGQYQADALVDSDLFDALDSSLPSSDVNDVLFDGTTLYVATAAGLCIASSPVAAFADGADLCTELLDTDNSILPDDEITALWLDLDQLWIGTNAGVARWDTATGVWYEFGAVTSHVNDIVVDGEMAWIATDTGAFRIHVTSGGITRFESNDWDGTTDVVRGLFRENTGATWFATDDGVVRYLAY